MPSRLYWMASKNQGSGINKTQQKQGKQMSRRYLYGAIDLSDFKALAIGTSEQKINEFIASYTAANKDKKTKHFKVAIETGKSYKVRLNIEDFTPVSTGHDDVAAKMRRLWELIYLFESDVSESNTEIYVFE